MKGAQELDMESRDSLARCNSDTNYCNGNGECYESRMTGDFFCVCDPGYKVDISGSCVGKNNDSH